MRASDVQSVRQFRPAAIHTAEPNIGDLGHLTERLEECGISPAERMVFQVVKGVIIKVSHEEHKEPGAPQRRATWG
jgi:hypothetical protein